MDNTSRTQLRWVIVTTVLLVSACTILGSAALGLNGHHVWRQADVLAQIEGFYHGKYVTPFENYFSQKICFDIPIYQALVASFARVFDIAPLYVARVLNFVSYVVVLVAGQFYINVRHKGSWLAYCILLGASPLVLHYFSVPLPDVFCIALNVAALVFLLSETLPMVLLGSLAFAVSAFIKSPVTFVFVVYYCFVSILDPALFNDRARLLRRIIPLCFALAGAIGSEMTRQAVLQADQLAKIGDYNWYFGSLSMRLQPVFYEKMLMRTLDSFPVHLLGIALFANVALNAFVERRATLTTALPYVIAFLSGWMIFSNVYFMHDYYELPVTILMFFGLAEFVAMTANRFGGAFVLRIGEKVGYGCFAAALAILLYIAPSIGSKSAPVFVDGVKYSLRHSDRLLLVTDDTRPNPAMGGLTNTKFVIVPKQQFETNCDAYLAQYPGILVSSGSQCLERHKQDAVTFIQDDGMTFFAFPQRKFEAEAQYGIFDATRTQLLASLFTTDDPSNYTSQMSMGDLGAAVSIDDLAFGAAMFHVDKHFGKIRLRLLRSLRYRDVAGAEAPLSCEIKLDGRIVECCDLRRLAPVDIELDLSSVELLKLKFIGARRTPYDVVNLQVL